MTTFANRDRMRDRARHIASAATAPAPLDDDYPERWMEPQRPRKQPPLFAMSKWASRAIGAALAIAAGVVAWILVSGR